MTEEVAAVIDFDNILRFITSICYINHEYWWNIIKCYEANIIAFKFYYW